MASLIENFQTMQSLKRHLSILIINPFSLQEEVIRLMKRPNLVYRAEGNLPAAFKCLGNGVKLQIKSGRHNNMCQEWVAVCTAAYIPLSKTDHPAVQQFLKKRVVNGGAIPHSKQLQKCYLEREYMRLLDIESILKDKQVELNTDKMSDDSCRFVMNELAAPLEITQMTKSEHTSWIPFTSSNKSYYRDSKMKCFEDCKNSTSNLTMQE